MKTIKLSEASRSLGEYARELDDDIVLVTRHNRPIAAVVSLRNVDQVLALSRNPQFLRIIERSRRDFAAGRSHSLAQVRDLFGLSARANKRPPARKKHARG